MNLLVVLAVLVAFGILRFLRVGLLVWALAWWVGTYILLRFGFTAPIPASVVSLYMGIVSIAIVAYVSSSQERRDEVSVPLVRERVRDEASLFRSETLHRICQCCFYCL